MINSEEGEMNNINKILASQLCFGCGTCNVICGHQAITMQYDNIGRLLPMIDESRCTNCGLCYMHCPSLDMKDIQLPDTDDKYLGNVVRVYIGKAIDERIYKNSQSGGLVTATLKYLFESGKIDAAIMCRVDDAVEYTPRAVMVTSVDELYACQKSSYVPIDIVSAMKHTEQYRSIAVVGTGCHIQGIRALQNFNKKYKEKVKYTLGLICDRTLCKTATDVLYDGYFKGVSKRLIWRDKSLNYKNARILIKTKDNRTAQIPTWKRHTLKDSFTNPRCRICFDKLNTSADFVFGDPWGMSNVDWNDGASVVISRTLEGESVLKEMHDNQYVNLNEAPLSEVITGQHIEKRKKDVSAALIYYKEKGWLTPSYSDKLGPSTENAQLSKLIEKFVKDTNLHKNEIIELNNKLLREAKIESEIKKVLYLPILILSKIKRLIVK